MRIGIIGAATVGWTLATKFAAADHDVLIANRSGPETLADRAAQSGLSITPVTLVEAQACDLVFLAPPWRSLRGVLTPELQWDGKTLVDTTNIFLSYAPDFEIDDLEGDSGSEIVARLAPGARVVKAFNTLPFTKMFGPLPSENLRRVLFVAGDDAEATTTVSALIAEIGLHPVVLGPLSTAGRQMELRGPLSGFELFTPKKDI